LIDNHYGHALTGARLERDANRPDRETDSLNLPAYRLVVQPAEGMGPGELDALWEGQLMPHLQSRPKDRIHFVGAPEAEIVALENGEFALPGYGIPRHPTQVYEALFYLFVYGLLILMALRGSFKASGRIFGAFLIGVFGFRFVVEFLKANQSSFEAGMALNMGQWLRLPLVAVGLYLLWQSRTKHQND